MNMIDFLLDAIRIIEKQGDKETLLSPSDSIILRTPVCQWVKQTIIIKA